MTLCQTTSSIDELMEAKQIFEQLGDYEFSRAKVVTCEHLIELERETVEKIEAQQRSEAGRKERKQIADEIYQKAILERRNTKYAEAIQDLTKLKNEYADIFAASHLDTLIGHCEREKKIAEERGKLKPNEEEKLITPEEKTNRFLSTGIYLILKALQTNAFRHVVMRFSRKSSYFSRIFSHSILLSSIGCCYLYFSRKFILYHHIHKAIL